MVCIVGGIYGCWSAFVRFDESILQEKDSQFYSILNTSDVNIDNSLDAFCREAETIFKRRALDEAIAGWRNTGDKSQLKEFFKNNSLKANPIYAGIVMYRRDDAVVSETVSKKIDYLEKKDGQGIRICKDDNGKYLIAYEYSRNKNISFDALIDPQQLYMSALGPDSDEGLILLDKSSHVTLIKPGTEVIVSGTDENADPSSRKCIDNIIRCQKAHKSGGVSLELTDEKGKEYTARMVVITADDTSNGEFALGITANYDRAAAPSRAAARTILLFGAVAVFGIMIMLILLLLLHRTNTANRQELETIKKKNETLAEINQQMQVLSHHQRLETIGTMTASIAHDFNNLLTPIMGYSIMTMEMLPSDAVDIQENLMEVYNASVKAKDMVQRLSDLSKKSRVEDYTELNPDEVVRNALKVTLPAKPENVDVKVRFKSGRNRVKGDNTQISQLVMNIVLNAYDAMREKGGTILISTRATGGNIELRFKDSGEGMSPETVSRIFDPFYTTKESGKGTGLGLAIVAQIVETHGGRIYVDSQLGEGTEFRILLPVSISTDTTELARTRVIRQKDIDDALHS